MTQFGARLKDCLIVSGLSRSALAKKVGVSRMTVGSWLAPGKVNMSAEHFILLSLTLNVGMLWLYSGIGEPHPPASMLLHRELARAKVV